MTFTAKFLKKLNRPIGRFVCLLTEEEDCEKERDEIVSFFALKKKKNDADNYQLLTSYINGKKALGRL